MLTAPTERKRFTGGAAKKTGRGTTRWERFSSNLRSPFHNVTVQQQLYSLVALGSILILSFVFFLGFQYYQFQNIRRSQYQLQRLLDQIDGADVTLRMAAQLGAATTDASWTIVHHDKEVEMETGLQNLIKFCVDLKQGDLAKKLRVDHGRLLETENAAFKLIKDSRSDFAGASKLLDTEDYQQKRQAFKENLQKTGKQITDFLQNRTANVQNRTIEVSVALLLLNLILVFPIIRVLRLTKDIAREREIAEQQLGRLNSCFLSFESNSQGNIQSLVDLCKELLEADGVTYQRIEDDKISSISSAGGVFCKSDESFENSLAEYVLDNISIIPLCWNLWDNSRQELASFLKTHCRSYMAQVVRSGDEPLGVLHVFYEKDVRPTAQNLRFITIVSSAIVPEERRQKAVETLRASEANLQHEREQLAVTLGSITDGVISTDLQNKIALMNRVAEKLTGWTFEEAQGKQLSEVFCISSRDNSCDSCLPTSTNRGSLSLQGITLKSQNGEEIAVEGNYAPIFHDDNSVVGHLVVFSDQREKQRLQAQVALSSKLQSIGQLAAGVAHEINTPMQFISDNTSFLRKSFDDVLELLKEYQTLESVCRQTEQFSNILNDIQSKGQDIDAEYLITEVPKAFTETLSGIERVTKLVKAMKTFSHPTQGKLQLCDLNQSIEATVNVSRNEWKYVADLELNLDPEIPMVPCLIDELNQVILNMINNSVDAIKDAMTQRENKKGTISIATRADKNEIKIILKDSGMGMPQEVINKIFDPFFTTKEPGKGTGQGLAISHDIIVNKHKGRVEVESEKGKGTQFTISLPLGTTV